MDFESCQQTTPFLPPWANVRRSRKIKQLTQEKLAGFASLDPTYISDIKRGLRNPGIKNVAKIAKALGKTTSELCKGWTRERREEKSPRWRGNFRLSLGKQSQSRELPQFSMRIRPRIVSHRHHFLRIWRRPTLNLSASSTSSAALVASASLSRKPRASVSFSVITTSLASKLPRQTSASSRTATSIKSTRQLFLRTTSFAPDFRANRSVLPGSNKNIVDDCMVSMI